MRNYRSNLKQLEHDPPDRFATVVSSFSYEAGDHPEPWWDYECAFAAEHVARVQPDEILDIGSLRSFVIGLLAHYPVTTVDIRARQAQFDNETVITSDAKALDIPDESFDAVVSLCALEHFGLGRYGDDIDMHGDELAFSEMVRVLRPGGRLIFSTAVRGGEAVLAFNEQRIYTLDLIRSLAGAALVAEDERGYSRTLQRFCTFDELAVSEPAPEPWDIYCGCWRKPASPV